ncbi:MAG: hypothetical protein R3C68_06310 [Myxococcota bacterium]
MSYLLLVLSALSSLAPKRTAVDAPSPPCRRKTVSDYSGKKPHIVDTITGRGGQVELFVACLGASNYTYAEATLSQKSHDWVISRPRLGVYGRCFTAHYS